MSEGTVPQPRKKIFFGWWIVISTSILTGIGWGFYGYGFGVIFKQVSADLGINRAMTSLAAGIGRMEAGIEAPLTGFLVDKFGPKWVMFTGVSFISIGLIMMSYIHSIWLYYIAWGFLVATGINLGITIPIDKTITNWFIKKRGLAMGIKMGFLSLSGVVVIPVVTWLTTSYGWRQTCWLWGILMAACLLLIIIFIKQKKPEYYGMLPDGATVKPGLNTDADLLGRGNEYATSVQEEEFTVREAFKTRAFWLLITASLGQIIAFSAVTVHLIPFLTDIGISATTAGFMMSLLVLFSAPARLIVGILTDRLGKNAMSYMLAGFYFLECLGISIFLFRPSLITIYVFLILFGIGNGAPGTLNILLRGRYFGRKSYGTITGFTSVITAPAGLLAPIYAGWIFDTTGSYTFAFWTLAALTAVSTILALLIRPPRKSSLPGPAKAEGTAG